MVPALYKRDRSQEKTLRYSEIRPGPPLSDAIRCIWVVRGTPDQGPAPDPVVPDGCVEIVLNFAEPFEQLLGTRRVRQPLAMIVGQSTRPVVIQPTASVDLVGIRFHPWAAHLLLRIPVGELRDQLVPLEDVRSFIRPDLLEAAATACTTAARLALLMQSLQAALANARPVAGEHHALAQLVQLVVGNTATASVRELSARTGHGMRSIQRLFETHVGVAPKTLMRIARVQRALRMAQLSPTMSWTTIGARAGYFDQSHLIRDFRALVGCVPSDFRAADDSMTHALLERPVGALASSSRT